MQSYFSELTDGSGVQMVLKAVLACRLARVELGGSRGYCCSHTF